jgi:predicted nucleotidyltransferase
VAAELDIIKEKIVRFHELIKDVFPVKHVLLYGSYAKGTANKESDIDVGVVVDLPNHLKRIEITSQLFHYAGKVDVFIEPKCIFWDEYQHPQHASILSEIIRTGITVI